MTFAKIALFLLGLLEPRQAASIAANALKAPSVAPALAQICWRESRCQPVGVHRSDARWSDRVFWRGASQRWLDLRCQNQFQGNWSTRGAFGLMAAYHARHVAPCTTPEYFDVPAISAFVAGMKLIEHCDRLIHHRHPATTRWASDDSLCSFVPFAHARSPAYQIAKAQVRVLLLQVMTNPHDPPRPAVPPEPSDVRDDGDDERRRDARAFPKVEKPETRTDGTGTPTRRRQG